MNFKNYSDFVFRSEFPKTASREKIEVRKTVKDFSIGMSDTMIAGNHRYFLRKSMIVSQET